MNHLPFTINSRKGQVTAYIGLAILIILLAATLLYMQQAGVKEEIGVAVRRIAVGPEAAPMQDYITACLDKTATDGVRAIASHGGWIKIPGRINRANPTEGDAVAISPTSDQGIAYWHYLSSPNTCEGTCTFSSLEPALKKPAGDSIENQLDQYIAANLNTCLAGFPSFNQQGYHVSAKGPLSVSSTITDNTVAVYANYPLRFEKPGASAETNEYFVALAAKLGQMHALADQITQLQKDHRFLERHARQLIDLQSGLGPEQVPPVYEVEFKFETGKVWSKTQVRQRVQDLLSTFTPFLQVFGTANYHKIYPSPSDKDKVLFDRIYNRNMLIITSAEKGWPDLEARFSYLPWWNPYFDLRGCEGDVCRAQVLLNTMRIPYGVQKYQFGYHISFPVMVELRDPAALQGRGLSFTFMLEGNTRLNEPMLGEYKPIKAEEGIGDTLFCDPGQLTGGNASVNLTDGRTSLGVEGADMIYTCGPGNNPGSSSCLIGKTDSKGAINNALPACIGGTITLLKEGYVPAYTPFDSDLPSSPAMRITLEPKRKITIDIQRYRLQKTPQGWRLDDTPISLDPDEEAHFILQRKGGPNEEAFMAAGSQFGDVIEDSRQGMRANLDIVPGNYTLDINTILKPTRPIIIPADRRCYEGQCFDAPKDPITFDADKNPLPLGGASYTIEIRRQDLDSHPTLRLYAIDAALDLIPESDRKIEDLDKIGDIEGLTAPYRRQIEPLWMGAR